MDNHPTVLFVCEHGAAKSVLAAAHFNRLAAQLGLQVRAIARGTEPEETLSPAAVQGLAEEGLTPTESLPQKLTAADVHSAQRIVSFCELPPEYQQKVKIERWNDVPPVSENYAKARDVIIEHIRRMLGE